MKTTRRSVVAGALAFPFTAAAAEEPFAALEKQSGARIGIAALDTGSGKRVLWRAAAAFVAFAGPLDLLTRLARRSSP